MANNMMNMQKLMKQAQKMQAELETKQKQLESQEFKGSDPAGMVTVILSGDKKIKDVQLDEEIVTPDDIDMLQDLLIIAFNNAIENVEKATEKQMGGLTKGFPGL